jgi:aspartyl-tRNA(Asn)/glutamyl-tRNA(Gln) amidotransferase subunit A
MARSTEDLHTLFGIMEGEDAKDSNCINFDNINKIRDPLRLKNNESNFADLRGVRVGIVQEFDIEELDPRNRAMQEQLRSLLKDSGATLVNVSMPLVKYALPFYFTLVPAEASSNLARYDGLKYGH